MRVDPVEIETWSAGIGAVAAVAAIGLAWSASRIRAPAGRRPANLERDLDQFLELRMKTVVETGQHERMLDNLALTALAIGALAACAGATAAFMA